MEILLDEFPHVRCTVPRLQTSIFVTEENVSVWVSMCAAEQKIVSSKGKIETSERVAEYHQFIR